MNDPRCPTQGDPLPQASHPQTSGDALESLRQWDQPSCIVGSGHQSDESEQRPLPDSNSQRCIVCKARNALHVANELSVDCAIVHDILDCIHRLRGTWARHVDKVDSDEGTARCVAHHSGTWCIGHRFRHLAIRSSFVKSCGTQILEAESLMPG